MFKEKQYNTRELYFSNRISDAMSGILEYPLTVMEAPMGYGKTTATREFLKSKKAIVLWQRIYDDDITSFWNGFASLFNELDMNCSKSLEYLGFPNNILTTKKAWNLIEKVSLPVHTVIVIDDYHLVDRPEINNLMTFISENTIENLHIILTARFTKFQKLEELKLKGQIYHITKENFKLMPKEISAYYRICGILINEGEAKSLYLLTEGWISALYLLMLEYIKDGMFTPVASIYKLIEQAVYVPLSDEIKTFLITMCIFDSFSLKQAEYMWNRGDAAFLLTTLTESNSFVHYDGKLKIYNIHSIFIDFLREELEKEKPAFKTMCYQKAGQWFATIGNGLTARKFFYACGDFNKIMTTLEQDKANDYTTINKELLKKYFAECPKEIKEKHYYALLIYCMHLFVHREFDLFHEHCHEIAENIEKDKHLAPAFRNRLLGELELLLSFSEFNDLKKMSERHKRAWELLKQPTSVYDTGVNWTFGSPSVLCMYYRESGKLSEHVSDLKEAMPYYNQLTNGHGSGAEYAMEAEVYFNQGEFENAEISVHKALLVAQEVGEKSIIISGTYLQILISFMRNDHSNVMQLINELSQDESNRQENYFINAVEICEGCIFAYLDQLDKIPERLNESDLTCPRIRFPSFPFFNIMYGRLLLIKADYLKLIGSSDYFNAISAVFQNQLGYVYTNIYLAAANIKIDRAQTAITQLKIALDIALPDKQYMPFAQNCDYIESLLKELLYDERYKEGIIKILALCEQFRHSKERMIKTYFKSDQPKLTQREMEIAHLAVTGITISEIGQKLFVSANTVKKAIKSIYSKLSINNRVLLRQYLDDLEDENEINPKRLP